MPETEKVFLPYQQELMTAVFENSVVIVEKSRRTGYTWATAAIAVLEASKEDGAQNCYYMGYDYEMAREFIETAGDWAKRFKILADEMREVVFKDPLNPEKDIKAFRVSFANGREIVALPSVARALRGKQGFVILDEAAFHDDLKEVCKAAMALLMWGGHVLILSTHNGVENYYNELLTDSRAGKRPYKVLRCTLDDALKDGLYKRICKQTHRPWSVQAEQTWRADLIAQYGEDADEELFCVPARGGGAYLPLGMIENCQEADIPVLRWKCADGFVDLSAYVREGETNDWLKESLDPILSEIKDTGLISYGMDFGRTGDLSVLWVLQEQQNLTLKTLFSVELSNVPHEQQKQILFYIIDRLPRFHHGAHDARGNGSYLAEAARQRFGAGHISEVMLSREWYRDNMPPMKARFEDKAITVPADADVRNDLRALKVVKGIPCLPDKRETGKGGEQRHGDSAIAVCLAVFAARSDLVEYECEIQRYGDFDNDDDDEDARLFGKGGY